MGIICPVCGKEGWLVKKWAKKPGFEYYYVNHRFKKASGEGYTYGSCYIGPVDSTKLSKLGIRKHKQVRTQDQLTPSEAERRVYPEVGKVDTVHDIREIIKAIENDNIPDDLKRKRLQYMYTITYSPQFQQRFKGDIEEARRLLKNAYQKYTKQEAT